MKRIENLEREVRKLSREELSAFRNWFRQYDADEWDHQIEQDVQAGKLETLADEAIAEHKEGRVKEL